MRKYGRKNGMKGKKVGEKEGGREEEGKEGRSWAIIAQNYIGTLGNRMSVLECKYYLLQQVNTVLGLDRCWFGASGYITHKKRF